MVKSQGILELKYPQLIAVNFDNEIQYTINLLVTIRKITSI